ncbi:MAG: HAD family hydrolase [Chloroflexi bacterium]|nr:HAD family hydrolase [Chloroflexota bacterium]
MRIVLSFDIDGTLEVGDPPGGVTMEMVRKAHEAGYLIGSCSDRPLSSQRLLWQRHNIPFHFVAAKHQLHEVKGKVEADSYYHIGDRDVDFAAAESAGFGFWWNHEAEAEPWLLIELKD